MKNIMSFKDVSFQVGSKRILDKLSFDIPYSSIVGFLGPNGSGKTTTLRAASGILDCDEGEILLLNKPLKNSKKDDVVFIQDDPWIYPELTGKEYLEFISDIFNKNVNINDYDRFINSLRLKSCLEKQVSKYSFGMKKKLLLLSIIIINPKLILLDEFISGIDPINLITIKEFLHQFVKSGGTVVVSTHQLDMVQTICDKVLFITNGIIRNPIQETSKILQEYKSFENYFLHMEEGLSNEI